MHLHVLLFPIVFKSIIRVAVCITQYVKYKYVIILIDSAPNIVQMYVSANKGKKSTANDLLPLPMLEISLESAT